MKKNLAEAAQEFAKTLSEIHQSPSRYAALLRASHDIELMWIDQPKAPRSAKRTSEKSTAVKAGIWAAKYPFMRDESIDPIITKALTSGKSAEVFKAIAKGSDMARDGAQLSSFARHVITALTVALFIMEIQKTIPTKKLVKIESENVFKAKKWNGFIGDDQRWTEYFSAAGLKDLPEDNKPRGKGKHGDII